MKYFTHMLMKSQIQQTACSNSNTWTNTTTKNMATSRTLHSAWTISSRNCTTFLQSSFIIFTLLVYVCWWQLSAAFDKFSQHINSNVMHREYHSNTEIIVVTNSKSYNKTETLLFALWKYSLGQTTHTQSKVSLEWLLTLTTQNYYEMTQ